MKKNFSFRLHLICVIFVIVIVCRDLVHSNGDIQMETQNQLTKQISSHNHNRLRNSCNSEAFYHDYMINERDVEPFENFWNSAKVNESATLRHICLKQNGLPVVRKCKFNPQRGAEWESIGNWNRVKCLERPRERILTPKLNSVYKNVFKNRLTVENRRQIIKDVDRILLDSPNSLVLPADIYYTTEILHTVFENSSDAEVSEEIVDICSSVMTIKEHVLRKAAEINSTNRFLENFENYMNALTEQFVPSARCGSSMATRFNPNHLSNQTIETIDYSHIGVFGHLTTNVSVFFINPKCTNISGIAIYDSLAISTDGSLRINFHESKQNFSYRFLYATENVTDLMKEPGIHVATFVPQRILEYIKEQWPFREPLIVVKFYAHDSLFVETSNVQTCRPSGKITSISIPGFSDNFPEPLPLLVRSQRKDLNASYGACGYWNYGTWLKDGIETRTFNDAPGPLAVCFTKHLTQFSFLLGGNYETRSYNDKILINPIHIKALNIIAITGCSLSLLGLIGIWTTAALFKNWRKLPSTKILLNLSSALTLQMIFLLFVNMKDITEKLIKKKSYYECIALGALLQYILLVLFTWMLIIAILQFQRYVKIIGINRPSHYIFKSAIVAWSFPLIPTLIVAFVDPDGYTPTLCEIKMNGKICYPSGYGLAFGVVFPIILICIANLIIFIYVFYSISHTLNQTIIGHEKKLIIKQIHLSILLFFLLGLCYIFGIFSFMSEDLLFSYLFCITATLQGFVLFIYFILLSDVPRRAWCEFLCIRKQHKVQNKLREMQSITVTSAVESGNDQR